MDKHDIDKLKRQVNIVDVIDSYVRLRMAKTTRLAAHSTVRKHHLLPLAKISNFIIALVASPKVMLLTG